MRIETFITTGVLMFAAAGLLFGCGSDHLKTIGQAEVELAVPRGYVDTLEVDRRGRILGFGPFVGYYFLPPDPGDLTRLRFVCFNERGFYSSDAPVNAQLFKGEAVFTALADVDFSIPKKNRIHPVYFKETPGEWLENRPEPRAEFLHFHSCYNDAGPVLAGYWIRHQAVRAFTYDMGGRVTEDSPLYHKVTTGPDTRFARIVEFDRGPGSGADG